MPCALGLCSPSRASGRAGRLIAGLELGQGMYSGCAMTRVCVFHNHILYTVYDIAYTVPQLLLLSPAPEGAGSSSDHQLAGPRPRH